MPRAINERGGGGGGIHGDGVGVALWPPERQARQGLAHPARRFVSQPLISLVSFAGHGDRPPAGCLV